MELDYDNDIRQLLWFSSWYTKNSVNKNETLFRGCDLKLLVRAQSSYIYKLVFELEHNLKITLSHRALLMDVL